MKRGNDLILGGGDSQVTIANFFLGGDYAVDSFTFESGGQISGAQIFGAYGLSLPNVAESDQTVNLPDQRLFAQVITSDDSGQGLFGSSDDELLLGHDGNDTLSGGGGNDTLIGGGGNDNYLFELGDGQDTINNYDTGVGTVDTLELDKDLALDDLWFSQSGNDLQIDIIGTDDKLTISNWYSSDAYKLEEVHVNGSNILNNQLEQLVSAMSSYDVESEEMTPEARSQLQPIWDDILNN
jgi:Ca2+-binding RTX toxin-like protein